jgi:transposase-like protein
MTKTRRTYTREFKLEAVHLWQTGGKSAAQIERDLDIDGSCLYRWKRTLAKEGENAFPGHGRLTPEQERVRQLEREVEILRQERDILKRSDHLLAPKPVRFCRTGTVRFIEDHWDEFPVTRMCKVLAVLSSGYYAWRQRPPSARETANQELFKKIEVVYNENHGVYGSPRIYRELRDQGVACSENRIARLMRLRGLHAKQSKGFKTTTKRNKAHPAAPNLLKRDFTADRPDEKWLADITYIATLEGWL